MKSVVFLDIDGVLNSRGSRHTCKEFLGYQSTTMTSLSHKTDAESFMRKFIDPYCVRNLNYLMANLVGEPEICISSAWGKHYKMEQFCGALADRGFDYQHLLKGFTPKKFTSNRCHEIHWALQEMLKVYTGEIRWITLDDKVIFPKSYLDMMFTKLPRARLIYPEHKVDPNNGLVFTDVLTVLHYMNPNFRPPMEEL